MSKETVESVLDNLFKEHYGKNKFLFQKYQELYDLPTVVSYCEVSSKLFDYCLRKKYFVLLLIYDETGKIFLNRVMSDILEWGLPGCSVKNDETINDSLNRLAKSIYPGLLLDNVETITLIQNIYQFNKQECIHFGLGFIARARLKNNEKIDYKKLVGDFVQINDNEFSYINRKASKKMVEEFEKRYKEIIKKTNECFGEDEIVTNENCLKRYKIHNRYMKKYILTNKRKKKKEFKSIIKEKIYGAKSIIDISCGDDSFIFDLSRELECNLVVGNDISWSQVETLNKKYNEVIFTNHNGVFLPFKKNYFDVSYCSNTLHHMQNKETLINLLYSAFEVSKKLIIVEIENPKVTGGFPYLLNKYWYIGFLKDVGGAYLTQEQFKILINEVFYNKADIKISNFKNIMGNYMIAEIIKKEGVNNGKKN